MSKNEDFPTLQQVVGRNVRALREAAGDRQEDTARNAQASGLDWNRSTVAAIEAGTRAVGLHELPMLALALHQSDLSLLFAGDGRVRVSETATVKLSVYRAMVDGSFGTEVHPFGDFDTPAVREMHEAAPRMLAGFRRQMRRYDRLWPGANLGQLSQAEKAASGEAEQKAARRFEVKPELLSIAAHGRWGRSLTEERDSRVAAHAAPDASPRSLQALRGHVTRQLLEELEPVLKEVR